MTLAHAVDIVRAAVTGPARRQHASFLAFAVGTGDARFVVAMVPFFEDDEDPKKPRPVETSKKREGWMERTESRKDNDRDGHRHVHVRC